MNRQDLDLEIEHTELLELLAAAKAEYNAAVGAIPPSVHAAVITAIDAGDVTAAHRALSDHRASVPTDRLDAAKRALREFRARWRTIRRAFAPVPVDGDGVAEPEPVHASAAVEEI